jgi:hypothetical protein
MFLPLRAPSEAINLDYWPTSQTFIEHQPVPMAHRPVPSHAAQGFITCVLRRRRVQHEGAQ